LDEHFLSKFLEEENFALRCLRVSQGCDGKFLTQFHHCHNLEKLTLGCDFNWRRNVSFKEMTESLMQMSSLTELDLVDISLDGDEAGLGKSMSRLLGHPSIKSLKLNCPIYDVQKVMKMFWVPLTANPPLEKLE
jgi:hypothetical protein